jgi:uncharacterized membrane protein YkgB
MKEDPMREDVNTTVLGFFDPARTRQIGLAGQIVLRYGLVALLVLWGSWKFFEFEAEAIRPLIEESPLMSWMYRLLGVRGTSSLIGVVELVSASLICARRWRPDLSAIGSLIATGTFLTTLSFLVTTPGVLAPDNPWGGFLLKDIILLGASLITAAEALQAAQARKAIAR